MRHSPPGRPAATRIAATASATCSSSGSTSATGTPSEPPPTASWSFDFRRRRIRTLTTSSKPSPPRSILPNRRRPCETTTSPLSRACGPRSRPTATWPDTRSTGLAGFGFGTDVSASSMTSSKGLEFDHVFISVPSKQADFPTTHRDIRPLPGSRTEGSSDRLHESPRVGRCDLLGLVSRPVRRPNVTGRALPL